MKTVGLFDAKTRFSALCREVSETGEEITITRHGQILARLVPPLATPLPPRVPGRFSGQFRIPDEAFFAPLSAAELADWDNSELVPPGTGTTPPSA